MAAVAVALVYLALGAAPRPPELPWADTAAGSRRRGASRNANHAASVGGLALPRSTANIRECVIAAYSSTTVTVGETDTYPDPLSGK